MATPASLPDTPAVQASPQSLSLAFGGTLAMSAGLNKMVTDIANIWAKVGVGAANQIASAAGAGRVNLTKLDGTTELLVPHWYNSLRNGGVERWPDGTSIAVPASTNGAAGYGPDQWNLKTNASQACHWNRVTGLTDGSQYAAQVIRDSGQTGTGTLVAEQAYKLEDIINGRFRNQKCSLSLSVKAGANYSPTSGNLTIRVACGTGSAARRGGSPYTSETTLISQTVPITTSVSPLQYVSSVVVPTNTTQMSISFEWTPVGTAGADDSFTIDDVMLVPGDVPMAFKAPPNDDYRCLELYEKSFAYGTAPGATTVADSVEFGGSDNNTTKFIFSKGFFKTQKRGGVATFTVWDCAGHSGKISTIAADSTQTDNVSPLIGATGGTEGFRVVHSGTIAGVRYHYVADNRL